MNPVQSAAFESEISLAQLLIARGELEQGFAHLERAHVIGQAFVAPHVRSHWLMLKVEFMRGRPVAAFGQVISMFQRMPIAPELQDLIDGRAPPDVRR